MTSRMNCVLPKSKTRLNQSTLDINYTLLFALGPSSKCITQRTIVLFKTKQTQTQFLTSDV